MWTLQMVPSTQRAAPGTEWVTSGHGDHYASFDVTCLGWDPWVATVFGPLFLPHSGTRINLLQREAGSASSQGLGEPVQHLAETKGFPER